MLIEIVDALRCITPHAESWLVGAFDVVEGRDVITGLLGCPVCNAEYPIRDGAVWFAEGGRSTALGGAASEKEATRIAAFLDLTDPRGFAVLTGSWAVHAPIVSGLSPTHLVLLNPPAETAPAPGLTIVYSASRLPFALASARGAAIDGEFGAAIATAMVAVVQPGGRLIGPVPVPVPPGMRELARDETTWIAERAPEPVMVPLTRR